MHWSSLPVELELRQTLQEGHKKVLAPMHHTPANTHYGPGVSAQSHLPALPLSGKPIKS